ncbi:GlxA family transcriptional regulator [Methyloligella sp. 2.7D]|uniref:GlxA family transcriptional regulator n=1 Tax=unclassified Methyloligella TaxID=2625955 RepID=UPI00157C3904|nr:GlxA family transcriptional regulator [Methyloligella sp. GL2]QKP76016.1 GlxA family transcriptional regulator [Methyloligella sp. GL2]
MSELISDRAATDARQAVLYAGAESPHRADLNGSAGGEDSAAKLASLSKFTFLILDEFPAIVLDSAIEVLRIAERITGPGSYSWSIITPGGEPVVSGNGLALHQTADYAGGDNRDIVLVCGGANVAKHADQNTVALLRRMARDGVMLGGMCNGSYALAKAGLLDGYRCTIHWDNLANLQESHRDIQLLEELFVLDRDRITCAGGIAPIDMMLALVGLRFDKSLVAEIADQLVLERVRDSRDRQRVPPAARCGFNNPVLVKVAAIMEANLEEPLSAAAIAQTVNLSLRQLQRMFKAALDLTPSEYYKHLRLRRGRELLLQSQMSVTEVAVCCGFHSIGQFSREYRAFYGRTPRSERQLAASAPQDCPVAADG